MTKYTAKLAVGFLVGLALSVLTFFAVTAFTRTGSFIQAESVQRVHTIGERCESTAHQAKVLHHNLPASHQGEAQWFAKSYRRCLVSLAKVEKRAGVKYHP